jgi:hypothetical protein
MSTISFALERTVIFCADFAHISKVDIRQSDHVHTFSIGKVFPLIRPNRKEDLRFHGNITTFKRSTVK